MKQLSCKALGADCDFVAKGQTDEDVIRQVQEHAKTDHPDEWTQMQKMSNEEKNKMMKDMKSKMQTV